MPIEMRPLGAKEEKHAALPTEQLPKFRLAILPVILPVAMIGAGTLASTFADREDLAKLQIADITDFEQFASVLSEGTNLLMDNQHRHQEFLEARDSPMQSGPFW